MSRTVSCPADRRRGFTLIELLVSATLLVSIFALVTPLAVRTGRLWQECRYCRLGLDELADQLDRLRSLDQDALASALEHLVPSEPIRAALPNPRLTAEILADRDGTRLVLRLSWDRSPRAKQIMLVGWLDPLPTGDTEPDRGSAELESGEQAP
jgi:prepilin-type N-terminal cleavage/methylation domain-containing protein